MSYDKQNIFAKILRGEIPCGTVYEDDEVLAFNDIAAAAPVHVLVTPKDEYISFNDFCLKGGADKVGRFFQRVQQIADELGLANEGYRIITNHGKNASQSVPHFHVHILGGLPLGGLLANDKLTR